MQVHSNAILSPFMTTSPAFTKLYKKLNAEQRRAVDAIEGPVMVVAGPGTGKTQILTLRIANILRKTDASPDSILALTFTEAGVTAMRKRLVEIIGSDAYRVAIHTFHGFANDLIGRFPDEYPRIIGSRNINDIDKITILKNLIQTTPLTLLKPFGDPFYYLQPLKSALSELKRENISSKEAHARVQSQKEAYASTSDLLHEKGPHKGKLKGKYVDWERKIQKNQELVTIYAAYEATLREEKLYDYDDMIIETVAALQRSPEFLLSLQENYQYLLADEHQDANNSQNKLLELLSSFHDAPNLFLVGDEKQAIYRFQGASLENFLYFKQRFPAAELIQLTENYRSVQPILNAAHTLITSGPLSEFQLHDPLKANQTGKATSPAVRIFSRPEFQYTYIAEDIRRRIDEGVEPFEIAVLYRNNSDVAALTPALERARVPYLIESDQNVFEDADIEKFIILLRSVALFGSDEKLAPLLYLDFLAIPPMDAYRIFRARQRNHTSLYDLIRSRPALKAAGVEEIEKVTTLFRQLTSWSTFSKNRGLLDALEVIARESGFWNHIVGHERAQEKLDKYNDLVRDIEQLVELHRNYRLDDLLRYLSLLSEHNIMIKRTRRYSRTPSVRLMTAHRAKGLEFDVVYMPDVVWGHWGHQRMTSHFSVTETDEGHNSLDDERRLFYVALTRARVALTLSYARQGRDGKERLPSQFVEEIDSTQLTREAMGAFEAKLTPQMLLTPRPPVLLPAIEMSYLRELFLEQGLSVTALNNYLRCPWDYLFGNLLRVPKAPTQSMLFGTAIHAALNDFFNVLSKDGDPGVEYLLGHFKEHVTRLPLSEHDFAVSQKKGERGLSGYYKAWKTSMIPSMANEFSIAIPFRLPTGESITLRGILDKIELIGDGTVRVIDYKTGAPKTRNHILGTTKSSDGDYFRQLVFYKLLLSHFDGGKYEMTEGVIDFVEPDKAGRYHRESFQVTEDDVAQLKEVIINSAKEILSLSFWSEPCDPKVTIFCKLQEMLQQAPRSSSTN